MKFSIPVYVEEQRRPNAPVPIYAARPLFFTAPARKGERLQRVLTRLAGELRQHLTQLGSEPRHDQLASWSFSPELDEQQVEVHLVLKAGSRRSRFLFVTFKALGRKLAFTPSVPDLWFELIRGQSLPGRATEVLNHHFRAEEKKDDPVKPEDVELTSKAWLTTLEFDLRVTQKVVKKEFQPFAFLGGREILSGAEELRKTGRCLDWLYPDELDRVVLRERELEELTRLLTASDKRPILLVGPRKVGKTALVHEFVFQNVSKRKVRFASRKNVWLLSPQRLVSGMSFVGQWENRLLAILKEAGKQGHILYFDDLLGLFLAGINSSSSLSVAQVMKPYLERREVRVLAEITPEAFRILQERDRSFADLFHLMPVREPTEDENQRILLSVTRQLEEQHHCGFMLDAMPAVIDLEARYVSELAFPGKAAGFLRQLAVKFKQATISRYLVLNEFQARSGLSVSFLDAQEKLGRREILSALQLRLVGQNDALDAAADAIATAKARLNDPGRPLASFLYLGPTGVGKTQCAKAIAGYLFGQEDRLLRFDMNEFISAHSVAQLVGTFQQPEGLLTSAIRRQPFSVVLLDEIEKAHPSVFDLLLQVLGEGRLTDALGRTANFTNAIVILTSNLGARESRAVPGFRGEHVSDAEVYRSAAEKFFRPEFFNRLDRIVPFHPLSREQIELIAIGLINDVLNRGGLRQRKGLLRVHPNAMPRLIDQGFHPQLGARALKRVVEREIAQPVAARLAALEPGTPMVIQVYPGPDGLAVHVQGLTYAKKMPSLAAEFDPEELQDRITLALERLEGEIEQLAPAGAVTFGEISLRHERYFALKEQLRSVRHRLRGLTAPSPRPRGPARPSSANRQTQGRKLRRVTWNPNAPYKQLLAAEHWRSFFDEPDAAAYGSQPADRLAELAGEVALLQTMAQAGDLNDRVLLYSDTNESLPAGLMEFKETCFKLFENFWGFRVTKVEMPPGEKGSHYGLIALILDLSLPLVIEGPNAARIVGVEAGTHLFSEGDNAIPVPVRLIPLSPTDDPLKIWKQHSANPNLAAETGPAMPPEAPAAPFAPVIRVYQRGGTTVDLRSGLASPAWPGVQELRTFILSQLPLPEELTR